MMEDYTNALFYCESSVEIAQRSLPQDHPDLQVYRESLDVLKKEIVRK